MADYRDDIFRIVQMLAPTEHEEGRFGDRGADAILKYFRDTIAKDVQSFNKALRLVNSSEPTGDLKEEELVNMAVAIHLGKTNRMEYKYRDFSAQAWKFYPAYMELRNEPKFNYHFTQRRTTDTSDNGGEDSGSVGDAIEPPALDLSTVAQPANDYRNSTGKKKHLLEKEKQQRQHEKDANFKRLCLAVEVRNRQQAESMQL